MLNRNLFREAPDVVRASLRRRGADAARLADVDRFIDLDERVRALTVRLEEGRHEIKKASQAIGEALKAGKTGSVGGAFGDADAARERVRRVKQELEAAEAELAGAAAERDELELGFPNLLDPAVPPGASEADNVVLRTWGEPPRLGFPPRAHDDLGEALGLLDFERGAKVSGARFTFLRGAGARLEHALIRFMREIHQAAGDAEVFPPLLVSRETLTGTGQLPKFEADLFKVQSDPELFLIPTAEVPVTNLHRDEILEAAQLPLRYFAYSPCFRSEAGSYGKDVRGYIRQHHFNKVELVRFATPEQSAAELEEMTDRAEEVLRRLGLHHRVVRLCAADTGFGAAVTNDVEVWLPSQGAFREISSCSSCADFQARRARIRYRPEQGARPAFVHTLNGSGLAVGRTLVAILEQCQRADGGVAIPGALAPYFGASEIPPR
jgi:seryl-tRNA synthetase